jgi:hypothetical protein
MTVSKLVERPRNPRDRRLKGKAGRVAGGTPNSLRLVDPSRFEAVIEAAARQGLLGQRSSRIAGRVSQALVEQAKKRTGIESDSELIKFALASIALEDRFSAVFEKSRGSVDPDLKLGF